MHNTPELGARQCYRVPIGHLNGQRATSDGRHDMHAGQAGTRHRQAGIRMLSYRAPFCLERPSSFRCVTDRPSPCACYYLHSMHVAMGESARQSRASAVCVHALVTGTDTKVCKFETISPFICCTVLYGVCGVRQNFWVRTVFSGCQCSSPFPLHYLSSTHRPEASKRKTWK